VKNLHKEHGFITLNPFKPFGLSFNHPFC